MSRVILQPSGSKEATAHYSNTVKKPVRLATIKDTIGEDELKTLESIYHSGKCYIWGVTPGGNNVTKWDRICPGDIALFSRKGGIFSSAVVTHTLHHPKLAKELWDVNKKGETWEYIYFLDEVKKRHIPYSVFNPIARYQKNFIIQGFSVLSEEKSLSLLDSFNLKRELYFKEMSQKEFESSIDTQDELNLKSTEGEVIVLQRKEQGHLRARLFKEKDIFKCACCQRELPISFLIAAHIKKRAFCVKDEKRNPNIVMPMCKLGCDELYEQGYISVKDGKFISLPKSTITSTIKDYIDNIKGNVCDYFNSNTVAYFNWHLEYHE